MPAGKPLSNRSRQTARTLEAYLTNGAPPRWMERIMQIENGVARVRRELGERHERLRAEDPEGFAARWREIAQAQRFDELNALIAAHNTYYPMERDLPMDPRTGEYVLVRPFERPLLDADWVLAEFPA